MSVPKVNVIDAVRFYIDKIVCDPAIAGMKALILDASTTKIVSMVYSQTQILEKEVYLVEQLAKKRENMHHLKAAFFLHPNEANIESLIQELREPKYSEYHLFFSNVVPHDALVRLSRADEHEVVRQVHEYYADFLAVNEDFFHLGLSDTLNLSSPLSRTLESGQNFERNVNGILGVLLSLKRKPAQIRYQGSSELARRIASDIVTNIERDDIFEFRTPGPLLLILDRKDDPITPLLTQWTYQAMVHELLGLNYNRVLLKGVPGIKKDLEEVVLSCTQDDFFAKNRNSNFGDLGSSVKSMLDSYQKESKLNEKISSIEDMQNFMQRYPAFRSKSINVSKHVTIMSELARLTDKYQLLDISQLEQEIACSVDHSAHKRELFQKISNQRLQLADKIRLAILFLLRYESYDDSHDLKLKLAECGASPLELQQLHAILEYAGDNRRAPGLFTGGGSGVENIVSKLGKALDAFSGNSNVMGMQNVYTQHQPLLSYTLEAISKGKLKDSTFPSLVGSSNNSSFKFSEVIVFIVGGTTFEEATKVAEFNQLQAGNIRVVLGGSCVHNSRSFLKEIINSFGN